MMDSALEKQLIRHEGLKLKPYVCTSGKITIGVGRNLTDRGVSKAEAMAMLAADIAQARADVEKLLDYYRVAKWTVSQARYEALVNLSFNMGIVNLGNFKKMFAAIAREDWQAAAAELMDSLYAQQVGQRAVELADQLRTGNYR